MDFHTTTPIFEKHQFQKYKNINWARESTVCRPYVLYISTSKKISILLVVLEAMWLLSGRNLSRVVIF